MLTGYEEDQDDTYNKIWTVPYKGYKLTKIKMWKSSTTMSGFEVTYSALSNYSGWSDYTKRFGCTVLTSALQEITFTEEITKVNVCVNTNEGAHNDLEGFTFTEADGTV